MSLHVANVTKAKRQDVEVLKTLLKQHKTIMLVKIDKVTSSAMHRMRADLRGTAVLRMAKNSNMSRAMQELETEVPGLSGLAEHLKGPTAFLCTDGNAFKIASMLAKNKLPAPAKAGSIATADVIIEPINTGIPPGPAIAELQSLGLRTRIEQGTIKIMEQTVVCHTGERVSRTLSAVLSRLGIEPFEVGLSVVAAVEDGTLFVGNELIIDVDQILNNLISGAARAFALAVNIPIPTAATMPIILSKASGQAISLSVHSAIATQRSLPHLLGRAVASAKSLAAKIAAVDPTAASAS